MGPTQPDSRLFLAQQGPVADRGQAAWAFFAASNSQLKVGSLVRSQPRLLVLMRDFRGRPGPLHLGLPEPSPRPHTHCCSGA